MPGRLELGRQVGSFLVGTASPSLRAKAHSSISSVETVPFFLRPDAVDGGGDDGDDENENDGCRVTGLNVSTLVFILRGFYLARWIFYQLVFRGRIVPIGASFRNRADLVRLQENFGHC